jgi:pimeloyl-ACP methyl ester carboxylesterase
MSTWVLLRGLTREAEHWGDFRTLLARELGAERSVTIDLPGTGQRVREPSPLQVEAIMQACRGALLAQPVRPPYVLVGLSLGGMVAAAWASAWPGELAGCVLINSSMRPFSRLQERLRLRQWPTLLQVLATRDPVRAERTVLRLTSAAPLEHADVLDAWVAIRRARPVSGANALRQLLAAARYRHPGPAPRVPVLVASGGADALVNPVCSATLARRWGAPHIVEPRAGHDLPLDAGPWLAAELARWARAALPTESR